MARETVVFNIQSGQSMTPQRSHERSQHVYLESVNVDTSQPTGSHLLYHLYRVRCHTTAATTRHKTYIYIANHQPYGIERVVDTLLLGLLPCFLLILVRPTKVHRGEGKGCTSVSLMAVVVREGGTPFSGIPEVRLFEVPTCCWVTFSHVTRATVHNRGTFDTTPLCHTCLLSTVQHDMGARHIRLPPTNASETGYRVGWCAGGFNIR